jgi:hypothetical protein
MNRPLTVATLLVILVFFALIGCYA